MCNSVANVQLSGFGLEIGVRNFLFSDMDWI